MSDSDLERRQLGDMPPEFRHWSEDTRQYKISSQLYAVLKNLYESGDIVLVIDDPSHEEQLANSAVNAAVNLNDEIKGWEHAKPLDFVQKGSSDV